MSLESVAPTLFTIGSGSLIGFLAVFAIKRIFKILAVIVGLFFAALMYFQSQNLISVNWDKIQSMSQGLVSTLAHSLTDTGQISTITGNLGIPLTGGLAAGFAIGVMKG
ncbi:MAG: FUN14 domain-containing protein [Nitrososphaeraceae archaeon]